MKIKVTWRDIFAGAPTKTNECMVALALKRELGTTYASVGIREARIRQNGQYLRLRLPEIVQRKIRFWDLHHFVLPFSFEYSSLDILPNFERRETRKKVVETHAELGEPMLV
jgi:hypothetical protein